MVTVECPYCREEIKVFDDPDLYEWDGECGECRYSCKSCKSLVAVEVEATIEIVNVEPYAESEQFAQEMYEQYCESLADWKREEG